MEVNKIQSNLTFGYNRKLNKKLIKRLDMEHENDHVASTIRDLNTFCNNTEDMLKIYDKNGSAQSDELFQALMSSKITLASLVEHKYPELNYAKIERDTYESEAANIAKKGTEKYPWQFSIANELSEIVDAGKVEELTPEQKKKLNEAEKRAAEQKRTNKNQTNAAPKTDNNVIEKFEPNDFSPKGFESLGGMDELKEDLYDKIIYPVLNPQQAALDFEEYGKRAPRGILLYGPPGCGKTSVTEALAVESGLPLFKLKISKAGSPYINSTSINYQNAFDYVADYSRYIEAPCFMLIDEIDGMTKGRGKEASSEDLKQMGTLLNLIETARDRNIVVIAATNKYDIIDEAIKRRFDEQIYVGMPDMQTREDVLYKTLAQWLKGIPLAEAPEDLHEIAEKLDGFPTSAIVIIADKASNAARKDGRRIIKKEDFFNEIEKNRNLQISENDYRSVKSYPRIGFNTGLGIKTNNK